MSWEAAVALNEYFEKCIYPWGASRCTWPKGKQKMTEKVAQSKQHWLQKPAGVLGGPSTTLCSCLSSQIYALPRSTQKSVNKTMKTIQKGVSWDVKLFAWAALAARKRSHIPQFWKRFSIFSFCVLTQINFKGDKAFHTWVTEHKYCSHSHIHLTPWKADKLILFNL